MGWRLDRETDRWVGHDYPAMVGPSFTTYERDEMELGARAALMIDEPDQAWWELIGLRAMHPESRQQDSQDPGEQAQ